MATTKPAIVLCEETTKLLTALKTEFAGVHKGLLTAATTARNFAIRYVKGWLAFEAENPEQTQTEYHRYICPEIPADPAARRTSAIYERAKYFMREGRNALGLSKAKGGGKSLKILASTAYAALAMGAAVTSVDRIVVAVASLQKWPAKDARRKALAEKLADIEPLIALEPPEEVAPSQPEPAVKVAAGGKRK